MDNAKWIGTTGQSALVAAMVVLGATSGCGSRSGGYNPVYSSDPYNASVASNPNGASGGMYAGQPGPGPQGGPPAAGGAGVQAPPGTAPNVTRWLQSADQMLRTRSYSPGGLQQRNFGPGETYSFPLATQPGSCYSVFALGGPGANDVDLTIVAPSGQSIQQDTNTDPHPNVTFCPQEYGLHLARVTMFNGQGSVLFAVYQGPANSQGNVAAAFEGGGGSPAVATAPTTADPGTGARIEALRAQLSGNGYRPAGQVVALALGEREERAIPVPLGAGWCYAFGTFGGPGVRDSDITVVDSLNRHIATDTGTAVDAIVQDVCPPTSGTYTLNIRSYSGAGPVWFLPMIRPNAQAPAAAAATPSQTPVAIAAVPTSSSGGGLVANFRRVERNLVQRGWAVIPAAATTAAVTPQGVPVPIQLDSGQCYAITALGDTGVQSLNIVLVDAQGREVDRDRTQSAQPIVRVCPTTSGAYTARLTATGEGQFRLGVLRWGTGTSGAGLSGLLFVRNAELTRILQADSYQADTDFDIVRARIRPNATEHRNVSLRAGSCYAMVAVGEAGVGDLDLSVHNGRTQVAVDDTHSASPEVRFCAQTAGRYEVAIHAAVGGGEYVYRVFKRQEQPTP